MIGPRARLQTCLLLCMHSQICQHIRSQCTYHSEHRFGDLFYTFTNLNTYTQTLNTHLQIPVHIDKFQCTLQDSFTHLQIRSRTQIWIQLHNSPLTLANSSATIMVPQMNTAKIAIVSIHFVEETVWDRHFFKVAVGQIFHMV